MFIVFLFKKYIIYIVNNLYMGPIVPQAVSEYAWNYKTLNKFHDTCTLH